MRLECNDLTYTYPQSLTPVVENLSFSIDACGFHSVFGPSGVGKTSIARLLADPSSHKAHGIATVGIGTVLYSYNRERLPGWSSTGSHLDKVCPAGKESLKDELIRVFEMAPFLGSRFAMLSMGQQNRINLIRYLVQDFDLLILDESLANVDEALRERIILAIKALFEDRMFLYISHNLAEVARFCRDILVLGESAGQKGGTVVQGLDYEAQDTQDRTRIDAAMLEIMNVV